MWRAFLRTRLCQWLSLRIMVPINSLAHRKWPFEEPDRGRWTQPKFLHLVVIFLNRPFRRTRAQYGRDFRTVPQVRIPLGPPAWPQPLILCARLSAIGPILAAT